MVSVVIGHGGKGVSRCSPIRRPEMASTSFSRLHACAGIEQVELVAAKATSRFDS